MPTITRRSVLAAAGAALLPRPSRAARPLNLLLLMTDQHHHAVLGCAGHPTVRTPNFDRLAAEGVRFTHAFCPTPYCTPSRAAMVTGRYGHAAGLWANLEGGDGANTSELRLREPASTFFHRLADRGYACHWVGKWHLGNPHELRCFAAGREDVEAPRALVNRRRREAGEAGLGPGPVNGQELVQQVVLQPHIAAAHRVWKDDPNRSPQDLSTIGRSRFGPELQPEAAFTDHVCELLRRHRDEPFAIGWSVSPPHALWTAPSPFYEQYDPAACSLPASWDDRPERYASTQSARLGALLGEAGVRELLRCYYAQVTMMDAFAGRILDTLEALHLADRTLVLFTSDHGDMQGAHGMVDKSVPSFYDEIERVPLLMRLPGAISAGRTCGAGASLVDLAPTILDYLGAGAITGAHGRSLRPFVDGAPDDGRPTFAERGDPTRNSGARMIRTREAKLNVFGNGRRELFDLAADPLETRDVVDDPAHAALREELERRLAEQLRATDDPALTRLFGEG